jgi:hypothetical protein
VCGPRSNVCDASPFCHSPTKRCALSCCCRRSCLHTTGDAPLRSTTDTSTKRSLTRSTTREWCGALRAQPGDSDGQHPQWIESVCIDTQPHSPTRLLTCSGGAARDADTHILQGCLRNTLALNSNTCFCGRYGRSIYTMCKSYLKGFKTTCECDRASNDSLNEVARSTMCDMHTSSLEKPSINRSCTTSR